ncbi:MAG: hypothetical protein V2A55_02985 [Candidatus Jorgensenbacteria bacterium]
MSDGNILEEKWRKFLRLRFIFSFVPFLDFVIVSGSLATGRVHESSDFDVIIGARRGKIFTVRAFCVFIFGILGVRRRGMDEKKVSSDKVCFNHFVTPESYRLSLPYNDYWKKLYESLVPVCGKEDAVRGFFRANDWAVPTGRQAPRDKIFEEKYWHPMGFSPVRAFFELVLSGWLGRIFEKLVKSIQIRSIEKGIKNGVLGFKPRLRYSDKELEFHPDTRRIEKMIKGDLIF